LLATRELVVYFKDKRESREEEEKEEVMGWVRDG